MLSRTVADDILFFFYYFTEKIRLGIPCELSAEISSLTSSEKYKIIIKQMNK